MRLTIAYYYLEGKEPGDLKTVKSWARKNRVKVELVKDDADPL